MNPDDVHDPTGDGDTDNDADAALAEQAIARFAVAVEAVAPPVDLAACPRLGEAICALSDIGVSQEVADWWYTVGKACAGLVIDDTQCDTADAGYATAAVMYARLVLGHPLENTDAIVESAKLALAWDAGRRDTALASPFAPPQTYGPPSG